MSRCGGVDCARNGENLDSVALYKARARVFASAERSLPRIRIFDLQCRAPKWAGPTVVQSGTSLVTSKLPPPSSEGVGISSAWPRESALRAHKTKRAYFWLLRVIRATNPGPNGALTRAFPQGNASRVDANFRKGNAAARGEKSHAHGGYLSYFIGDRVYE